MKKLSILGSTGSIGTSTLKLVERHPDKFVVEALVGGKNIKRLAEQVLKYKPRFVSTQTEEGLQALRELCASVPEMEYGFGSEGAETAAAIPEVDCVVSAIVGSAGLRPTLAAAKAGKQIALANKESLVVAGALVNQTVRENGAKLLPVDSEHSAILQCLDGTPKESWKRIILTASGGPFFAKKGKNLSAVTVEEALKHPNWSMGPKITIDSATLMNKGLEAIEAKWLFDVPTEKLDVIIHPQSIVHSMVEFLDGSTLAQMGVPDMMGPIAYALSYPDRIDRVLPSLDFAAIRELSFFEPDHQRFPLLNLALQSLNAGTTFPAVLNGANEKTVEAFIQKQISFTDISAMNAQVLGEFKQNSGSTVEDFLAADAWGRNRAANIIGTRT